jgi:D-glycero-alpha-D-manno-heptose-7-phosphate kinase
MYDAIMSSVSVLSCAPLRISFLGGGTDFASFYKKNGGAVVAAAIDKYVYVHIKKHDPLFQERYRVSYSEVEHCQTRSEIKNDIVRASLELLEMDVPLQISTSADLPANSGLGSSSSFAVALLLGLHTLKGEFVGAAQLAEEACKVEIEILKSPIGKQDQYAAAFGGLNLFEFKSNDSISIEPLSTQYPKVKALFNNLTLVWTQQSRSANSVLSDQETRALENENLLIELKNLAIDFRNELKAENQELERLGLLIKKGWDIKKKLSPLIENNLVASLIEEVSALSGSLGAKLLGAGGGGFVLSVNEKPSNKISQNESKWPTFSPNLDHQGARILASN